MTPSHATTSAGAAETLTTDAISVEYAEIIAGLDPAQVQAIWLATLFGRRPPSDALAERARMLTDLRDRVGRARKGTLA